jgi:hypothetical protein
MVALPVFAHAPHMAAAAQLSGKHTRQPDWIRLAKGLLRFSAIFSDFGEGHFGFLRVQAVHAGFLSRRKMKTMEMSIFHVESVCFHRRAATIAQIASTSPNGQAPCKKP